jgi:hypothetical protein
LIFIKQYFILHLSSTRTTYAQSYTQNGSVMHVECDRRIRRRYMDGDVVDRVKGLRVQGVANKKFKKYII